MLVGACRSRKGDQSCYDFDHEQYVCLETIPLFFPRSLSVTIATHRWLSTISINVRNELFPHNYKVISKQWPRYTIRRVVCV